MKYLGGRGLLITPLFSTSVLRGTSTGLVCLWTWYKCHLNGILFPPQHSRILKNAEFLLGSVMSKVEAMYESRDLHFPTQLQTINTHFRKLTSAVASKQVHMVWYVCLCVLIYSIDIHASGAFNLIYSLIWNILVY